MFLRTARPVGIIFKRYYHLTKPGIIYGNCVSAAAGFLLAARGTIDWLLLLAVLTGMASVIASACVLNNYTDRTIDEKMARTNGRALVRGTIPAGRALALAACLCLAGFTILTIFTNLLTVYSGLAGLYIYLIAYGIWKRRSSFGTVVGSIAGAMPIVAGYVAVTGRLDSAVGLLFAALVCWQMPHFYAIAMYRMEDYRQAGLPVLPVISGTRRTKFYIMAYIIGFGISTSLLTVFGHTGITFLIGTSIISLVWLWKGLVGFKANDDTVWARRMFRFSLLVMLLLSLLLAVDWLLP